MSWTWPASPRVIGVSHCLAVVGLVALEAQFDLVRTSRIARCASSAFARAAAVVIIVATPAAATHVAAALKDTRLTAAPHASRREIVAPALTANTARAPASPAACAA